MHKLTDRSQPHHVHREFTLVYIALGSVLIVTLRALLMWYLHQQQCNARWGFIKALFVVIPVMVLAFIFIWLVGQGDRRQATGEKISP